VENEKKKNIGLLIIMIIVAMLFSAGGWILGKNYANIEDKKDNQKTEEKGNQQENNNEGTTNEEIEALGKQLFEMINFDDGWQFFSHYYFIKDKINQSTLNEENKNSSVLTSLFKRNEIDYSSTYKKEVCENSDFYNMINPDDEQIEACLITNISKDVFSNEYYRLFGNTITTFPEKIGAFVDEYDDCYLSNDVYNCYKRTVTVGDDNECLGKFRYVSSNTVNNDLIVNIESYVENCSEDVDPVRYNNEFGGQYNLTFKQNTNGDWYWYSTNKVN
jgi:hypothetical protein